MINDLIIGGYEGNNDILIFVNEAYRRCLHVGQPPEYFELEDNISDVIHDSGFGTFLLKGVPISRFEIVDMLELILMELKIEYIDSMGMHQNDAQNIMFEEMLE
jgi:hypothetical protein